MFLNKLGSVLKSGGGVLNWKYISNLVTSEIVTVLLPSLDIKKPLCWEGDIFFPKIFLCYRRDYPPQTDILTLYKGGYGGRGPHIGG
jgi:hypothetical protein